MKIALILGAVLIVVGLAVMGVQSLRDHRAGYRSTSQRARGMRTFLIGVAIAMLGIIIAGGAAVIHAALPWLGRL